ncbi:hypothetical protein SKAU_G00204360 [Synaphobranchus kaupii]|uniref:Secreted protein n=1 Tax=Synaphobranchus kaupii TaxID=118154 RepID=A0A9Q1FG38_SYNKA|nr:hypothetical protein SKAU_G00204360 [Synaphobranchus kaupii]
MGMPIAVYLGVSLLTLFAVGLDCASIKRGNRLGAVPLRKARPRRSGAQPDMTQYSSLKGGGGQHYTPGEHPRSSYRGFSQTSEFPLLDGVPPVIPLG